MRTSTQAVLNEEEHVPQIAHITTPAARVMWQAEPSLTTGVECWITAGSAHHTVLSYGVTAEMMRDWAQMMDIEFVHINKDAAVESLEHDLFLSDLAWKLK